MKTSVLAVALGYAAILAAIVATFPFILAWEGAQSPLLILALLVAMGFVASVGGGYIVRWVGGPKAPQRGMMVVLGLFAGLAAAAAVAGREPFVVQLLHPLSMAAGVPLGGWLRARQQNGMAP